MARELRESSRPRFDVTYGKEATGLLSVQGGAPVTDKATFEFVARGRVPHLLIKLGFLSMSAAAKRVAASLGEKGQGDGSKAKVHIAVTALGVQPTPLVSRDVMPSQLDSDEETAFLRFEEFAFAPSVYADAYDRVSQAMRMGRPEELYVTCLLRESSTNQTIGSARIPLLPVLQEHVERTYLYDKTPLMPPRRSPQPGLAYDTPVGFLSVSLVTDWGLSNTNAGEFGNSAFEFMRKRRGLPSGAATSPTLPSAVASPKPPRALARDRLYLSRELTGASSLAADAGEGASTGAPSAGPAAAPASGIKLDVARYAAYERSKAHLKPKERQVQAFFL